ncbi:MAG: hypothetical protein R6V52_00420 [Bacteroidales bacterium]
MNLSGVTKCRLKSCPRYNEEKELSDEDGSFYLMQVDTQKPEYMYYAYVIYSQKHDVFYPGFASDV